MKFLEDLMIKAKNSPKRIVLPEGTEPRTLEAANIILGEAAAKIILIGNRAKIEQMATENGFLNIKKAEIIDPDNYEKMSLYSNLLFDIRKSKGLTMEDAEKLARDPLYLACLLIKNGDADGELAGAENTTGNVLRPAFQIVKTLPGIKVVSGVFFMFTPKEEFGKNGLILFADCAVNPCPNAEELAQIAVSSAQTAKALADIEPRVAMLSFSTKGSAKHELVDKVNEATKIAKEMAPNIEIDGEMQLDAALVASVGEKKAPNSTVAGKANVLVFPDLQAGNIGYKLVERLSNTVAVGPILQGMAAPVNDLSRGCSVEDIVNMIIITATQSIK